MTDHLGLALAFQPVFIAPIETDGARPCCAEYSLVTDCDGETDYYKCFVCDRKWSAPCPHGDLVAVPADPDARRI